jgi:hypothetical protein
MRTDLFWWICEDKHESVHAEDEILDLVIYPRCGLVINGQVCMKRLNRRIRRAEGV